MKDKKISELPEDSSLEVPSFILDEISSEINKSLELNFNDCEHGLDGCCCCNCIHLVTINCHPANKEIGNGSILKSFGYGCNLKFEDEPKDRIQSIVFSEKLHGMCECHCKNKEK